MRAGDLGQEKAVMAEPCAAGRLCAARLGAQHPVPTACNGITELPSCFSPGCANTTWWGGSVGATSLLPLG